VGVLFRSSVSIANIVIELDAYLGDYLEKLTVLPKSNFVIKITKDDKLWQISTEKETVCDEWINELIQNAQKPPSTPLILTNRKETRILRAQKKVGRTIATSAPGKKNHKRSSRDRGIQKY